MASVNRRRRGKSMHLDLQGADDKPPLAALFLVQFDVKAGYTIAWKRSESGLGLQESVEFKSLPSGLHNVKEDLIYFMHGDDYAGISAFVNRSTEHVERNALMLAVGALVPLEQGRLGKSWRHAADLKKIVQELAQDPTKTQLLEDFWQAHQFKKESAEGQDSDSSQRKPRRPSIAASVNSQKRKSPAGFPSGAPGSGLSAHHPARSISALIDTFGPLIYPLYKAALLRKRILIITEAPVEEACNFVYDLSIISNIPSAVSELIPLEPLPTRLQPLFSIGVHDIDELTKRSGGGQPGQEDLGYGWVACTTDDVLQMKTNLYDLIVKLPPTHTKQATEHVWPTVKTPDGQEIKATQRDSRRYRVLRQSQRRSRLSTPNRTSTSRPSTSSSVRDEATNTDDDTDQTPLLNRDSNDPSDHPSVSAPTPSASASPEADADAEDPYPDPDETLIEPMSWSALAYNSFIWWASAGEKRSDLDEEAEQDAALFRNLDAYADRPGSSGSRSRRLSGSTQLSGAGAGPLTPGAMVVEPAGGVPPEMSVIAYFHRLTGVVLGRVGECVDAAEGEGDQEEGKDGEGEGEGVVRVSGDDMRRMGLDVWSEGDRRFVEELVEFYWGRKAEVLGGRIECCGVRIV